LKQNFNVKALAVYFKIKESSSLTITSTGVARIAAKPMWLKLIIILCTRMQNIGKLFASDWLPRHSYRCRLFSKTVRRCTVHVNIRFLCWLILQRNLCDCRTGSFIFSQLFFYKEIRLVSYMSLSLLASSEPSRLGGVMVMVLATELKVRRLKSRDGYLKAVSVARLPSEEK
jgi:hypothetical protein